MADERPVRFQASHRYARMSARKARPILGLIRGRDVNRAMEILGFETRRAASATRKVLQSALANAEAVIQDRGLQIDPEELLVMEARADVGPTLKRWLPRARGMATPILKRTCHISITLGRKPGEETRTEAPPGPPKAEKQPPKKRVSKKARGESPGTEKAPEEEGKGGESGS